MKSYIIITGFAFGLLALAHIARLLAEGVYLIKEPIFLLTTIVSAGLCVWALVLLKQSSLLRPGSTKSEKFNDKE